MSARHGVVETAVRHRPVSLEDAQQIVAGCSDAASHGLCRGRPPGVSSGRLPGNALKSVAADERGYPVWNWGVCGRERGNVASRIGTENRRRVPALPARIATSDTSGVVIREGRVRPASGRSARGRVAPWSEPICPFPPGSSTWPGGSSEGRGGFGLLPNPGRDRPLRPGGRPRPLDRHRLDGVCLPKGLDEFRKLPGWSCLRLGPSCCVADNATFSSSRKAESSAMYRSCGKVAPSRASKSRSFVSESDSSRRSSSHLVS